MRSDANVSASLQVEEEKNELSHLANQENQPAQLNASHEPNVIMNQEQVDELVEEVLQPKHHTFAGIPIEAEEPDPNSPFKNASTASGGVNSALKQLRPQQSGSKIGQGSMTLQESKLERRKNARQ